MCDLTPSMLFDSTIVEGTAVVDKKRASVVLCVGDVGYEVICFGPLAESVRTVGRGTFPLIYVHTQAMIVNTSKLISTTFATDDIGFMSLFNLLIDINGVGCATAARLLDVCSGKVDEFLDLIIKGKTNDVVKLARGTSFGQKAILQLEGRREAVSEIRSQFFGGAKSGLSVAHTEVESAVAQSLDQLGFPFDERARNVLLSMGDELEDDENIEARVQRVVREVIQRGRG